MIKTHAPITRKDFIIVVNDDKPQLAAIALSYLYKKNEYLPIFTYQNVGIAQDSPATDPDPFLIQRRRAEHFSVFINNAILENGGCENLIYLGLTEQQKSFLSVHNYYNTLDIETLEEIPAYLGGFGVDKVESLGCSIEQLGSGTFRALKQSFILVVGDYNPELDEPDGEVHDGIVVVEHIPTADFIVAVGYAATVGAELVIVHALGERGEENIRYLLEGWQRGETDDLANLKEKIFSRIGHVDFIVYSYATFFTEGLPYTILVKEIPASMVNLIYRPDFFVFNAIRAEQAEQLGSAVVFSPSLFKDEEETAKLITLFEFENYYQRLIIGKKANVFNLKNTIENYPFGLLHICSHGGDVDGMNCQVKFITADKNQHNIEFSHVLTIAITPYEDLHAVQSMYYFKKLDGLTWRSEGLNALGYSNEFYAALPNIISKAFNQKKVTYLGKALSIPSTNAIRCTSGQNYPATFDHLAAPQTHAFIFNNTCWSWSGVSDNFLLGGCKGYVGTLRKVQNRDAVRFAIIFYEKVFESNILTAFHEASKDFLKKNDLQVYIYWGLHFSTLKNTNPVHQNKVAVLESLGESAAAWQNKLEHLEGSLPLLKGKVKDVRWLTYDVVGTTLGHEPR